MKSKQKILVIGGDMRQIHCASRLSSVYTAAVVGFDNKLIPSESSFIPTADAVPFDYAVLPVIPLDEAGMISTPCYDGSISAVDIKKLLSPNSIIFAGRIDERLHTAFEGYKLYDYMKSEALNLKNAVPTAEGAVQLALEELPVTLSGLRVLIVGMGRIGRALAEILKGFGSDVTAAVRNAKGTANARLHGIKSVCIDKIDGNYNLVFNTVPHIIFNRELLGKFGKDTLFIDLASKPGGIDLNASAQIGVKTIWALGLPGKTAPVTAGEIIAETIIDMITEMEEEHG